MHWLPFILLDYSNDIQLTHYDPIQAAGDGDENAKQILLAGGMTANLIKQAEAFACHHRKRLGHWVWQL